MLLFFLHSKQIFHYAFRKSLKVTFPVFFPCMLCMLCVPVFFMTSIPNISLVLPGVWTKRNLQTQINFPSLEVHILKFTNEMNCLPRARSSLLGFFKGDYCIIA